MPYDENGQWYDVNDNEERVYANPDDKYKYADYVSPDGSWHSYNRTTGEETTGPAGTTPPFPLPGSQQTPGSAGPDYSKLEAAAKQRLGNLYTPEALQSIIANASYGTGATGPSQAALNDWLNRVTNKELLRAGNVEGSTYVPDGKGGYMVSPTGQRWTTANALAYARTHPELGINQSVAGRAGTPGVPSGYGGQGGTGGTGGYPTPERMTMPTPTAPTPYYSQYQQNLFQAQVPEGYDARNRILNAILANPETMGQTQQDQLFEQQKELLNAQRAQQEAQLGQNLAARGLSGAGGTSLAGQLMAGQDFSSQLLGARRDIAVKAAQQNRQDQLAALQMQEALSQGDYSRMMDVYKSNQQERMNTENFLRQAAEMTQGNLLTYNTQQLQAAQAQEREMMDYYTFLENQRNARNLLNYQYTALGLGALTD